jgi:hypothetical protein
MNFDPGAKINRSPHDVGMRLSQEEELLTLANDTAKRLYDRAWATSLGGAGPDPGELVRGSPEERRAHAAQIKSLTDGATALEAP